MIKYSQGDIIRIEGFKDLYLILSKNAFIRTTGVFHVCPLLQKIEPGPLHIRVNGRNNTDGTVVCEQIKLIDPDKRSCSYKDSLIYADIMNVSDAVQGLFEYD